ncbi:ATP synthase F1 subunit epsilon [Nitriliruptor alkaliphilus]|uniref:ATP synthase F1 subunit epsilon n=1 Tax=Nitriliruptor alkaliphilus TaxID=427918 RepID=UPI0006990E53|nr:ATP synthase F1 subunit epsilon [Nitriliruptor alkaliphilus]
MQVEVVSAEKQLFSGEAKELYARALDGEIGIMPGHQPAVIALDIGPVNIRFEDGTNERIAVHNGFLYVGRDKTIVLADTAELASEIDTARAEAKVRELEQKLDREEDASLRSSLAKARLRVDVATRA